MRMLLAVILFGMLLAGCAADKAAPAPETPGAGAMPSGLEYAAPQPPPTGGIMLERTAEGVMTNASAGEQRETFDFTDAFDAAGRPIVYYFHSAGCSACKALRPEIDRLESLCAGADWREYNLANTSGSWAYLDFAAQHNLSMDQRFVPQVLVNGTIITDRFNINKTLEGLLADLNACQDGAPSG